MNDKTRGHRSRRQDRGPKGRPLNDQALAEVRALLTNRPRRRDLLIEFLHLIQDHYKCLSAAHLRALAEEMKISQAEVYEVASFYDHFDVVKEGEPKPAPITIRVCDSIACMLAGAEKLVTELQGKADPAAIRVMRAPCVGRCAGAPAARVGDREVDKATADGLLKMAKSGDTKVVIPKYTALEEYVAKGGYQTLKKVRAGTLTSEALQKTLGDAGLRGLGGAGFPAGKKWEIVQGLPVNEFSRAKITATENELKEEKAMVADLLPKA